MKGTAWTSSFSARWSNGLVVNSQAHLSEDTKLSSEMFLGALELIFLFGRFVIRRLNALSRDAVAVIPRERLSRVIYQHLDTRRTELITRAQQLSAVDDCELKKHEMYSELIGLTNTVTDLLSGQVHGNIRAISSTNIEDFQDEPLAEAYPAANTRAVDRYVVVQRLFVLDQAQSEDAEVIRIILRHDAALKPPPGGEPCAVKWLLKSQVYGADRTQDIAIFASEVLVKQSPGDDLAELTQDVEKISRARDVFVRLWDHPEAHTVEELRARPRR